MRPRHYALAIAALSLLVMLAAWGWAVARQPFTGPDEAIHYNSVTRVAAGGGWPLPYEARVSDATITAVAESGRAYGGQGLEVLPQPEERSLLFEGDEWEEHGRDQMLQHPPGYYMLVAGAVSMLGGGELRWDQGILAMRLISGALVAVAVPFVVGTARWATGSMRAGIVGGAAILLVPQVANLAGLVNNDTLLIAGCSAALYFAMRAWRSGSGLVWLLSASGVALGIALLSKGLALLLIPVIALMAILAVVRARVRPVRAALVVLLPLVIAFAIGGWWWLRNLILLGRIQPSLLGSRPPAEEAHAAFQGFPHFAIGFVRRLLSSAWSVSLDDIVGLVACGLLAVVLVIVLALSPFRVSVAVLWIFPLLVVVTIAQNAYGIYHDTGDPGRGVQGRYLYGGIAALSATVASAAILVSSRWRRSAVRLSSAAFCLVAAGVGGSALAFTVRMGGDGLAQGIADSAIAIGVPAWTAYAIAGAAALVLACLCALLVMRTGDAATDETTGSVLPRRRTMSPSAPA